MHVNKSPGPDGLTTEFYHTFWTELADDLCAVYNYAHEQEQLPDTQATSILRLLFKKGKRRHLKNWRPIALLNTDYKILSTTIANRLKPTLSQVIGEQQTCGIPGRTIFETTMALRNIVHDVKTRGANGILISLDQEKAFDRVNRPFLEKIMKKLNYGPSFLSWIQTLYAGANCKIINNGHLLSIRPCSPASGNQAGMFPVPPTICTSNRNCHRGAEKKPTNPWHNHSRNQ